jgi:hypothetical protein
MAGEFEVVVGGGAYRSEAAQAVHFPHRWTDGGVSVETQFTGAHLLHLAAAGCVLNDVYREGEALGVELDGVRVRAVGGFDPETWASTGVEYSVQLSTSAPADVQARLLATVDAVAEIPRALRGGTSVRRVPAGPSGRA